MDEVSIDVDHNFVDADDRPETVLAIDTKSTTLYVRLRREDFERFSAVDGRWWEDGCIGIGQCVGSPVWWSVDDDKLICLVGPDDQCWDVAVSMPRSTLARIVVALRDGT